MKRSSPTVLHLGLSDDEKGALDWPQRQASQADPDSIQRQESHSLPHSLR